MPDRRYDGQVVRALDENDLEDAMKRSDVAFSEKPARTSLLADGHEAAGVDERPSGEPFERTASYRPLAHGQLPRRTHR